MKFYETHYDDFYKSVHLSNFHAPFTPLFHNYIFYGPSGVGKYSQMIHTIRKFSPSQLKFENKIFSNIEKHAFFINISDVHYEVDMSLLGCNSKIIWHDIFLQIIDIISLKPHKMGFIVCKNFHEIHNELLEIFYSYMNILSLRSGNIPHHKNIATGSVDGGFTSFDEPIKTDVNVKFILLTEHLSFIPNNILNKCKIQSFGRPSKSTIEGGIGIQKSGFNKDKLREIMAETDGKTIRNLKEIYSFALMNDSGQMPKDNFRVVCDNIIERLNIETSASASASASSVFTNYAGFRDIQYDILIYNIDPLESICYILFYFLENDKIRHCYIDDLLNNLNTFMFQYANNYRSFFHLEYFIFSLFNYLQKSKELMTEVAINTPTLEALEMAHLVVGAVEAVVGEGVNIAPETVTIKRKTSIKTVPKAGKTQKKDTLKPANAVKNPKKQKG